MTTSLPDLASPEMADRIAAKDWSQTALGPAKGWPTTLKNVVTIMLASGFPMAVRWGPDLAMLYNDGYRAILGDKHPAALGLPFREAWPEVQEQLAPIHDEILAGKRGAYFAEDLVIRVRRHERWEDARFTVSYSPIPDEAPATGVGGVLITAVETTNRVLTEEALRASEQAVREHEANLRLVLDAATDGIDCIDSEGRTTMCNAAFLRMIGIEKEADAIGKSLHEVMHHSRPDGTRYPRDASPITRTARDGAPAHVNDEVFFRADGSAFPVEYWVTPILRDGALHGAVCTVTDITDRRRAEEQAELLVNELHHRVKNIMATIQAIAGQTFRAAPKEEQLAFTARIKALANAYDLLVIRDWEAATVADLVALTTAPFQEEAGGRIEIAGPEISLNATKSLLLVMALHELGTNAVKYGALSVEAGTVGVAWELEDGPPRLKLQWREAGGPVVKPPNRRGFGSVVIERGLQAEQGNARIEFAPSGVVCTIEIGL